MAELPALRRTAILRFALAYPGAYFSLPFAGDAGKRAFQAGPGLLRPPGGLEMMPAPGSKAEQASPRGPRPRPGIPAAADARGQRSRRRPRPGRRPALGHRRPAASRS